MLLIEATDEGKSMCIYTLFFFFFIRMYTITPQIFESDILFPILNIIDIFLLIFFGQGVERLCVFIGGIYV